jgi:hypothetical protein
MFSAGGVGQHVFMNELPLHVDLLWYNGHSQIATLVENGVDNMSTLGILSANLKPLSMQCHFQLAYQEILSHFRMLGGL